MHNSIKTDIIITLGPKSDSYETVVEAFRNGATIIRRALAYGTPNSQKSQAEMVREAAREAGVRACILDDSPGSKARLGSEVVEYKAQVGEMVVLSLKPGQASETRIPTKGLDQFVSAIQVGECLLIADGQIKLRIIEKHPNRLVCRVEVSGHAFRPNRGINFLESDVNYHSLTDRDIKNLRYSVMQPEVEYFALSFLEDPQDILCARQIVTDIDPTRNLKIIAKIETKRGMKNLNEIAKVADGLMVARGDLKLEAPYETLLRNQLRIINAAKQNSKHCIVATQFLDSMLESLMPSASDIISLGYTVLCGADAILVSQETALGQYPVDVVRAMYNIIKDAESLLQEYPNMQTFLEDSKIL